jgi:GNAT superfamily N-acetyltransferase
MKVQLLDVPPGKLASVITYLEMRAQPPARPDPPNRDWGLRHVTQPDAQWYRELFRRIGDDYLWFSRLMLSDDALLDIIRDPLVEIYALEHNGSDSGLLELDFRKPGECELIFFGVGSTLVGTGAARWLMNRALERVWSTSVTRFWVHTCTLDHPNALGFYLRSGFKPYRREVEILDDPRAVGILPPDAAPWIAKL